MGLLDLLKWRISDEPMLSTKEAYFEQNKSIIESPKYDNIVALIQKKYFCLFYYFFKF